MQWLIRLTDPLFGGQQPEAPAATGWLWRYVGVTGLLVAILVVRRSDVLFNPQFFAEDAHAYFSENLLYGFPRAFAHLYQGFPHLAQRGIAFLGGLGPATLAPRVYASCAVLLSALGLAAFSLPNFRHLVRSDSLRIAFGILVATLPMDAGGFEQTLGTVANLGWFLAIWLTLFAVMRVPSSLWRACALALAAAAAALSTPLAPVNGPLWGLRVLRGMIRRDPIEGVVGIAPLLALAAALAMTPQLGAKPAAKLYQQPVGISARTYLDHTTARLAGFIIRPDLLRITWDAAPRSTRGLGLGIAAALLLCAAYRHRSRPALLLVLYAFGASIGLMLYGRAALNILDPVAWVPNSLPARYRVYPLAMLCLATVALLDAIPAGRRRSLAGAAVALLFFWVRRPAFFIPAPADLDWNAQAPKLERALRERCPVQLRAAVHPTYMPLEVVWGPRYPQPPEAAEDVVAALGGDRIFAQQFVSRCAGLSEVELNLRAAASPSGSLRVDVFAADGATPVASASLPRSAIASGWNAFCFPPVAGSLGVQYVAVLSTTGIGPDAPVGVLGTAAQARTDDRAWFDGQRLTGSASLVHGCIDRAEASLPALERMQQR